MVEQSNGAPGTSRVQHPRRRVYPVRTATAGLSGDPQTALRRCFPRTRVEQAHRLCYLEQSRERAVERWGVIVAGSTRTAAVRFS